MIGCLMISTFLAEHATVVPAALLLITLLCVGVGYAIVRNRRYGKRGAWALAGLSVLVVFALTLSPSSGPGLEHVGCTVQLVVPTQLGVEGLANVALFFPPVFFAALATRRPLLMLVAGSGLSAAIEVLQALAPALGRACDTNDWMTNTIGSVGGGLLAGGTIALARLRAARRTS
jgi:hypothetical protein